MARVTSSERSMDGEHMSCTVRKIDNGWLKTTSRMGENGVYQLTETYHDKRPHVPGETMSAVAKAAGAGKRPRST